ncbi:hypothetical protein GE09DRAFT_1285316 [Coniochaeta sp. 2T2.1]|nr:hypothetical protein GE09DRAFT_1285316 [Coniochaeta sp. 2T2.1]
MAAVRVEASTTAEVSTTVTGNNNNNNSINTTAAHETFAVFPGQPVVDQSYHHQSGSAIPFAQPQTQQNPFAPAPVPAPAVVPIPAQWTQQQAQPQPSAPAQTQWAQQLQPQPQAQPYATAYQPLPDDCSKCGYCAETRAVVEKVASYVTDLHGVVRHTASFLANWSGLDVPSAQQHLQQLPHQPTPQPAQQPAQPQQPVLQQLASSSCCPPILGSWQTTDYYPVEMEMCSETGPCGLEEAQQPEAEPPAAPAPSLFATTFSPPQEMENVPRQVQASQAKFNPFATQQPAAPSQPYTDQQQQQQPPTGAQGYQQQQQQQQDNIIPPNPNLNPNPNTGDGQQQSTSRTWSNYRSRCG